MQETAASDVGRPALRVDYADFWPGFRKDDNYFHHLLQRRYDLEISDHPDLLLMSQFGTVHRRYDCARVAFLGENRRPNLWRYDFAFSFDPTTPDRRNYRLPLYILYGGLHDLTAPVDVDALVADRRRFCCMLVSNAAARKRLEFYHRLSRRKPVDSGGRVLNNVGGPVVDKRAFLRSYRFTIAFENTSHPGYTTEKILEALLAGTVPIYWGNPRIAEEFNPRRFVNVHDFRDEEAAIDRVLELENDQAAYRAVLGEPPLHGNAVDRALEPEAVLEQFAHIVSRLPTLRPVARRPWSRATRLGAAIAEARGHLRALRERR